MKKMILLSMFAIGLFANEQKAYHIIAIGGIGSQATYLKDQNSNVKWSNTDKTLHSYAGKLSGYGAIGLELDNTQRLFSRILLEASYANIPNIAQNASYRAYGIVIEEGYKLLPRFYTFGGPGIHYASLKLDDSSIKGIAVNVNLGFGFVVTPYANLEIMARGSFPLDKDFKKIGANEQILSARVDYFANIVIRF